MFNSLVRAKLKISNPMLQKEKYPLYWPSLKSFIAILHRVRENIINSNENIKAVACKAPIINTEAIRIAAINNQSRNY